ncbi:MAG: DinB family protein [Nocardioidaceae bacterium]
MTESPGDVARTADQVRAYNADLDQRLLALSHRLDVAMLADRDDEESWSAAEVLAHLGEFPRFFADDLRRLLADPAVPVGRTVEHEERLAAVASAKDKGVHELIAAMENAFADLADAVSRLGDDDLQLVTENRKYGAEPLTAFLARYVLGHKSGHLDQLGNKTPAGRRASEPR